MFWIAKLKAPGLPPLIPGMQASEAGLSFDRFCVVEEWESDLSNGVFRLGTLSEQLHGLTESECGLLTILRCYDAADRVSILEILENASSSPSSFCFSTHIITGPTERQPILCIGESGSLLEGENGTMHGVFIYPRVASQVNGMH